MKPDTEALLNDTIIKAKAKTDIERLIKEMKDELSQTWNEQSRSALIEAIRRVESRGGEITDYELQQIEKTLSKKLGAAFADKVDDALVQLQEAAFLMGATEATRSTGLRFAWRLPDVKSLDVLNENLTFWIGDYYKQDLQDNIKAALDQFYSGGFDRKQLIDALKEKIGGQFERADSYWDLLADHTATKVREIGRVSGYEQANIRKVQFRAHLDERTTKICRAMHGRIIEVKDMRGQVDNYLVACKTENKDKIKAAWPWIDDKKADKLAGKKTGDVVRSGACLPPLHARCRSITVAWFEADAKAIYGKDISSGDKKIIDAYSAREHVNSINDIQKNVNKIQWRDKDIQSDILKHVLISKHAKKEFGLETIDGYTRTSKEIIKNADTYFVRAFKGEPQYIFASSRDGGFTTVDRNWNIRGSYGHRKDFNKCLESFLRLKMAEMQF